jgi:hypothetical protein
MVSQKKNLSIVARAILIADGKVDSSIGSDPSVQRVSKDMSLIIKKRVCNEINVRASPLHWK